MFDDSCLAAPGHVDDCERGIADFADTADGKGVHDDLCRFANVHCAGGELKRHGRGHRGQHTGFHAASQPVGEHGNDAALFFHFFGKEHIARDQLAVLGTLTVIDFDEVFFQCIHFEFSRPLSSSSSGLNERTIEFKMISESAAFSPRR